MGKREALIICQEGTDDLATGVILELVSFPDQQNNIFIQKQDLASVFCIICGLQNKICLGFILNKLSLINGTRRNMPN
ncbi:unnamed protein product [Gordionus sp. m RMFG-2023]